MQAAFIILFLKRGHEKWRVSLENYAPIQPHEFNDFVIWLCRAERGKQTILSPITTHAGAAGSLFSCANPQRANDYIFFLEIKNVHGKNECALDSPLCLRWFPFLYFPAGQRSNVDMIKLQGFVQFKRKNHYLLIPWSQFTWEIFEFHTTI